MEQTYRVAKAAKELQVSTTALRTWETKGLIPKDRRHPNGQRFYTQQDVEAIRNWWLQSNK